MPSSWEYFHFTHLAFLLLVLIKQIPEIKTASSSHANVVEINAEDEALNAKQVTDLNLTFRGDFQRASEYEYLSLQ
jgi:hypothetical protein